MTPSRYSSGRRHNCRLGASSSFDRASQNALSRAAAEARGEHILWTDDDVLVGEWWLAKYVAAFRRWPEAGFCGGPIDPWFTGTLPHWLP